MSTPASDLPIIYTDVQQRPTALQLFESAEVLEAAGGKLESIADDTQQAVATEWRAQAQQLIKELDAERLETTEGARKTIERINARFNAPIEKLRGFVRSIDAALKKYIAAKAEAQRQERLEQERLQREEQAKREAEAAEKGVEPPPPPAPIVAPPAANPARLTGSHGASGGLRDNWKWRVKDISKVADNLLVAPEDRIQKPVMNSLAKAKAKEAIVAWRDLHPNEPLPTSFDDVIPGIEIYNDAVIATRTL